MKSIIYKIIFSILAVIYCAFMCYGFFTCAIMLSGFLMSLSWFWAIVVLIFFASLIYKTVAYIISIVFIPLNFFLEKLDLMPWIMAIMLSGTGVYTLIALWSAFVFDWKGLFTLIFISFAIAYLSFLMAYSALDRP